MYHLYLDNFACATIRLKMQQKKKTIFLVFRRDGIGSVNESIAALR
jgi:hypothetical protein